MPWDQAPATTFNQFNNANVMRCVSSDVVLAELIHCPDAAHALLSMLAFKPTELCLYHRDVLDNDAGRTYFSTPHQCSTPAVANAGSTNCAAQTVLTMWSDF